MVKSSTIYTALGTEAVVILLLLLAVAGVLFLQKKKIEEKMRQIEILAQEMDILRKEAAELKQKEETEFSVR